MKATFAIVVAIAGTIALMQTGLYGDARGMALRKPDDGGVVVREARLRATETAWLLDATIDIELPPAIRDGLDSGVPLQFILSVELREARAYRPDPRVIDVERRYELVYYELTRHYRVRSFDDGTARNYRSLPTALVGLGTLDDVPVAAVVGSGKPLRASVSLVLDERALPLPLQSPGRSSWYLPSEALTWALGAS